MLQYRLWRKNRRPPIEGEECSGVDLNRNFKYDWGGEEADDDPESLNYPGPAAESEPETKAIIEFINSHSSQIRAYVALHTAGQKLMYPCPPGRSSCFEENREVVRVWLTFLSYSAKNSVLVTGETGIRRSSCYQGDTWEDLPSREFRKCQLYEPMFSALTVF